MNVREVIRYRELLFFLVWRDVKIRYKQTILGAAWAVLQPLLTMIVFTVFFGRLTKVPSDGIPYPVFSYAALLPWTFFAAAITNAGNSLIANTDLLTKVYFPREILPISTVLAGLVDLGIASLLLFALLPIYGITPDWGIVMLPVAIALLVVLAVGLGMFLEAINVSYRDVKYALPFTVQLLLFITPVIYPTTVVPERFRSLMFLNPLSGIIETCRSALLPDRPIQWGQLGVSALVTAVVFVLGARYFHATERRFADII
ncbi:MAG: ABC transporter permease [Planctomycetota bacterium]